MNDHKAADRTRTRSTSRSQRAVSPPCSTGAVGGSSSRKEQLLALARDGDIEAASDLWREFGIQTGVRSCS